MLPHLYRLLPHPAASSALVEVLSESIFKFGKGTKILTEPLIAWFTGPAFQAVMTNADGGETYIPRGDIWSDTLTCRSQTPRTRSRH